MDDAPATDARLLERFGRRFKAGETVFEQGESGHDAFLLQEGRVRLYKRVRGMERSLVVLKPGDLFGESALIEGLTRNATAVALTDGVALALGESTLRTLLQNNPAIAARVLQQLVRRLRDLEDQIEFTMLRDVQSKVVAALLKTAASRGSGVVTASPLDLASRLGVDTDTVKRAVLRLRDAEYVRLEGERLEIIHLDGLKKLFELLTVQEQISATSHR